MLTFFPLLLPCVNVRLPGFLPIYLLLWPTHEQSAPTAKFFIAQLLLLTLFAANVRLSLILVG